MPPQVHSEEARRLLEHYNQMWASAADPLRRGEIEIDRFLATGEANRRRGMTIIARPSSEVRSCVGAFLEELREVEPDQYYYPAADFHVTILPLFTATAEPGPFLAKSDRYMAAVDALLPPADPIKIEFHGVTVSHAAVLIQGFPETSALNILRENLRHELHSRELGGTVDSRYKLQTAHMTVARFRAPLRDAGKFVNVLEASRNREFGVFVVESFQVVLNDWYMSSHALESIKGYT